MAKKKLLFESREFLNKRGFNSTAVVLTRLEKFITSDKSRKDIYNIDLEITDCNKKIYLELELNEELPKENKNTLYKLNTLIESLTGLKKAILKEMETFDKKKNKNKRKKIS